MGSLRLRLLASNWPPDAGPPMSAQRPSVIMTAPTVALVDSSIRMRPPGLPVAVVRVEEQRLGQPQAHPAHLVQPEPLGALVPVQGVDVQPVVQLTDDGLDRPGGVLDHQPVPGGQRPGIRHPADHRLHVLGDDRLVVRAADHVAAGDVQVVLEHQGHRHGRVGLRHGAVRGVDAGDVRGQPGREVHDLVPRLEHTAGHLARVAPVVVQVGVGGLVRPDHVLDRETDVDEIAVRGDVHVLQVVQQRRPVVPEHILRPLDHVVPVQGGDGDEAQVTDLQLRGEGGELLADPLEHPLVVVNQVHLVDRQDQVRHPEQRGEERMQAALLGQPVARVDQHDGQVGGGGAGDHVPGVLDVPRGVRDDELAARRGEVAVGHVDGDALLPLGAQAVGSSRARLV